MTYTSDGVSWHVGLVLMENECQLLHCLCGDEEWGWDEMCSVLIRVDWWNHDERVASEQTNNKGTERGLSSVPGGGSEQMGTTESGFV